jgi:hypothetical protein
MEQLNNFAKCTAIEGVEISQEELEALQEAANNNANFGQDEEVKIQDDFMVNKA